MPSYWPKALPCSSNYLPRRAYITKNFRRLRSKIPTRFPTVIGYRTSLDRPDLRILVHTVKPVDPSPQNVPALPGLEPSTSFHARSKLAPIRAWYCTCTYCKSCCSRSLTNPPSSQSSLSCQPGLRHTAFPTCRTPSGVCQSCEP